MSLPKCFELLNEAYFTNLIAQIGAATVETDLQALVNAVFNDLSVLESTIAGQTALLGPIADLLVAPGEDLGAIVTWIANFITNFLTPYVVPLTTYAAQLTALAAQVAALTSAIQAIATAKGWTITIPEVGVICTL